MLTDTIKQVENIAHFNLYLIFCRKSKPDMNWLKLFTLQLLIEFISSRLQDLKCAIVLALQMRALVGCSDKFSYAVAHRMDSDGNVGKTQERTILNYSPPTCTLYYSATVRYERPNTKITYFHFILFHQVGMRFHLHQLSIWNASTIHWPTRRQDGTASHVRERLDDQLPHLITSVKD